MMNASVAGSNLVSESSKAGNEKILVGKSIDGTRFPEKPKLTVSSLKDISVLLAVQTRAPEFASENKSAVGMKMKM